MTFANSPIYMYLLILYIFYFWLPVYTFKMLTNFWNAYRILKMSANSLHVKQSTNALVKIAWTIRHNKAKYADKQNLCTTGIHNIRTNIALQHLACALQWLRCVAIVLYCINFGRNAKIVHGIKQFALSCTTEH